MSSAEKAVQTLTAQWYNALCAGCNLNPATFQLVQGAVPLVSSEGTEQIWDILNAIPPKSINQYFDGSQGNLFSQNYSHVINSLASPAQAAQFEAALGTSGSDWFAYNKEHMQVPYSPGAYCQLFANWSMVNLPPSAAQKAITDCNEWQLNDVTQAQMMLVALSFGVPPNRLNANIPAFTVTFEGARQQLASGPARSFSMSSSSQSSETAHTWAKGKVSGGVDFFRASGNADYDKLTKSITDAGIQLTVQFDKIATVLAGPLALPSTDPVLSQYVPWYNSAALGLAYNDKAFWNTDASGSWSDTFGSSGDFQRVATQIVLVDGITLQMTSSAKLQSNDQQTLAAAVKGGCWPFFVASGSGGWNTSAVLDDSGTATITSQCAAGNPNVLGVSVESIGTYLGGD